MEDFSMKTLLSTTAVVFALGFPTLTFAQATDSATNAETQQQTGEMAGFLAARGESDLYASDLMGLDVYARRTVGETAETDDQAAMSADGTHDVTTMNRTDLDDMDNIGQINEIVLSNDGQVRALVIGIGGFLGVGEQDVAVTMDQVTFATDADDRSETYVVVNTGADLLQNSPAFERTGAMSDPMEGDGEAGAESTAMSDPVAGDGEAGAERTAFMAPEMEREGYERVEVTEISADLLMGKSVFDTNDNSVGDVTDLIIDDTGKISDVIIDFGGFLGIGSSQASIGFDEMTVISSEGYEDVRVYVDATKEQIEELPEYQATN
jgi:sporulation protein YlmC with PRC-barrel domain